MSNASPSRSKWVCPNDRMLALRSKVSIGWCVKTQNFGTFGQPSYVLDEAEQTAIKEVIKRSEDLERQEQLRVGRLVERLDKMKRSAVGSGKNECVLCGDQFKVLGAHGLICIDCGKAVCHKCGVETYSTVRKEAVWRCKICSETREMWKKSGAWFFKGLPRYVLPPRKPVKEGKYPINRRPGAQKATWCNIAAFRNEAVGNDSSSESDDDDQSQQPRTRASGRSVDLRSKVKKRYERCQKYP